MTTLLNVPGLGSPDPDLMKYTKTTWVDAATKAGISLVGFDPEGPFDARVAWARSAGLTIATIYARYSTDMQDSVEDQTRPCLDWATKNKMYVPPELLSVDRAAKGRKAHRAGLERLKAILKGRHATTLIVFAMSRLFRQAYKGFQFIREEVVEEGLRAVSMNGLDTDDKKTWRLKMLMFGFIDEQLLETIAQHVTQGLVGLFLDGYVTGAIPVGYYAKEVPGGKLTRRGLPRREPAVKEEIAAKIVEHYTLVAEGKCLNECWKKWRAEVGAYDPRSTTKNMSYGAYRRLLSRIAYIGVWQFGRKKNVWSDKRDSLKQEVQADEDVKLFRCEHLRIVTDELYWQVQRRLDGLKTGAKPRRPASDRRVWDMVVDVFECDACKHRFYTCGPFSRHMHCPNVDCLSKAMVNRQVAVTLVTQKLSQILAADSSLAPQIVEAMTSIKLDADLDGQLEARPRQIKKLTQKIDDLLELAGEGSDQDRAQLKAKIAAVRAERTTHELELSRLKNLDRQKKCGVTPETVTAALQDLTSLLTAVDGADTATVQKAVDIFRALVGNRIRVVVEQRPGRKRCSVKGCFTVDLVGALWNKLDLVATPPPCTAPPFETWLRKLPRVDRLADEVQVLYDVEKMSFPEINDLMEAKYQEKIGSGNCCASYRRWYNARGLPLPPRRVLMGRPCKNSA
jgi:DNA invertase Pin-like site-specific DNA recombinase